MNGAQGVSGVTAMVVSLFGFSSWMLDAGDMSAALIVNPRILTTPANAAGLLSCNGTSPAACSKVGNIVSMPSSSKSASRLTARVAIESFFRADFSSVGLDGSYAVSASLSFLPPIGPLKLLHREGRCTLGFCIAAVGISSSNMRSCRAVPKRKMTMHVRRRPPTPVSVPRNKSGRQTSRSARCQ